MDEIVIYSGRPQEGEFYSDNSFHRWVCGEPLRAQQKRIYCEDGAVVKELALPQSDVTVVCEYLSQPEGEAGANMRILLKGSQTSDVEQIIRAAEKEASKKVGSVPAI